MLRASTVGSSWNSADSSGLAPIRSPAATKMWFGFLASQLRPPRWPGARRRRQRTLTVLPGSRGSLMRMPPCGGFRLPWKSLMASDLDASPGSPVAAGGGRLQPASRAAVKPRTRETRCRRNGDGHGCERVSSVRACGGGPGCRPRAPPRCRPAGRWRRCESAPASAPRRRAIAATSVDVDARIGHGADAARGLEADLARAPSRRPRSRPASGARPRRRGADRRLAGAGLQEVGAVVQRDAAGAADQRRVAAVRRSRGSPSARRPSQARRTAAATQRRRLVAGQQRALGQHDVDLLRAGVRRWLAGVAQRALRCRCRRRGSWPPPPPRSPSAAAARASAAKRGHTHTAATWP